MKTLIYNIKEGMIEKGWNIRDLARESKIPYATVNRIVNGKVKSPRDDNIKDIARALGKTESQLRGLPSGESGIEATDPVQMEILKVFEMAREIIGEIDKPLTEDQTKELYKVAFTVGLEGSITKKQLSVIINHIFNKN